MPPCNVHPQTEAVDLCVSCGRGVCEACRVRIQGAAHCKECVEAGRIKGGAPQPAPGPGPTPPPMMMPQWVDPRSMFIPPSPEGTPDMGLFRTGAGGAMIAAIGCILIAAYSILGISRIFREDWVIIVMIGHIPYFALFPAYSGLQRNYGVPGATARFMILAGMLGTSLILWAIILSTALSSNSYMPSGIVFAFVVPFLLGIGFILAAAPLTAAAMRVPPAHESRVLLRRSGDFMLFAGIAFMTFFGLMVAGWIILAIALFSLSAALSKAPDPTAPLPGPLPGPMAPGPMPPLR